MVSSIPAFWTYLHCGESRKEIPKLSAFPILIRRSQRAATLQQGTGASPLIFFISASQVIAASSCQAALSPRHSCLVAAPFSFGAGESACKFRFETAPSAFVHPNVSSASAPMLLRPFKHCREATMIYASLCVAALLFFSSPAPNLANLTLTVTSC